MAFTENLKAKVRKRAQMGCCLCHEIGVEVHHIIPQEEDGPDSEDNAAPLCPSCHETYGANPTKRKFIREAREIWYELCAKRYVSEEQLTEIRQLISSSVSKDSFEEFSRQVLAHFNGDVPSTVPHRIGGQMEKGASASGDLEYELRGEERMNVEIWVFEKGRKDASVRLCQTQGWGYLRVSFSPNDAWIIVQDGGASLGVKLRLFWRISGAAFKEYEAQINDKAERTALSQSGFPDEERIFDHRYVRFSAWSHDSQYMMINMYGRGLTRKLGRRLGVRISWTGIYSLKTNEFTMDLQCMNGGGVEQSERTDTY